MPDRNSKNAHEATDGKPRAKAPQRCAVCKRRFLARNGAKTCSPRCRQKAFRRRKGITARRFVKRAIPQAKSHQRIVREQLAVLEPSPACGVDIKTSVVREIAYRDAAAVIEKFEYLGTMPVAVRHCFGLFFGPHLAAVAVFASEPGENLGIWDRYGYTGKIIALARGASLPWAHPHSASRLISRSMRLLPARYAVVTAATDSVAGEVGVVLQSANFDYVGTMATGGARLRVTDPRNGRVTSCRSARRKFGTASVEALLAAGLKIELIPRKGRYFAFRGPDRAALRAAISHRIREYPRRPAPATERAGGAEP
jgi:hypothetical protein